LKKRPDKPEVAALKRVLRYLPGLPHVIYGYRACLWEAGGKTLVLHLISRRGVTTLYDENSIGTEQFKKEEEVRIPLVRKGKRYFLVILTSHYFHSQKHLDKFDDPMTVEIRIGILLAERVTANDFALMPNDVRLELNWFRKSRLSFNVKVATDRNNPFHAIYTRLLAQLEALPLHVR